MTDSRLAIFGGTPVRTKPYPPHDTMIGEEEEREVFEVLRSGQLSGFSAANTAKLCGGPKVLALEEEFRKHFGVSHAVSMNSATSALYCAIQAIGAGPGDQIITSPFTMSGTASAILMNNAVPVFADIEEKTYCLDPSSVQERITKKTKAILTVNLFGHPSNLNDLRDLARSKHLRLIEDNTQSPDATYWGKKAGTMGDIGIQSLNFHKFVQCGEGGVALTDSELLAEKMRAARNHGEVQGHHDVLGGNFRMTELSAAVAAPQLKKLGSLVAVRRKLAKTMTDSMKSLPILEPPHVADGCTHSYYLYPMKYRADLFGIPRHRFAEAMRAEGISISEGYVRPLYLQPIYANGWATGKTGNAGRGFFSGKIEYVPGQCPVAERMWERDLLTTDICKYPNSEDEVLEFAQAAGKIAMCADELR